MLDITQIGLGLDIIGVSIIAIPDTRAIHWRWVGDLNNSRKKLAAVERLTSIGRVRHSSDLFSPLLILVENHTELDEIPGGPDEFNLTGRMGSGRVVAAIKYDEEPGNREGERQLIGGGELLQSWAVHDIRSSYTRIGLGLLLLGFILQFIGRFSIVPCPFL